jgi:hypothetical protein
MVLLLPWKKKQTMPKIINIKPNKCIVETTQEVRSYAKEKGVVTAMTVSEKGWV